LQGQGALPVVLEYRHCPRILPVSVGRHHVQPGIAVDVPDGREADVRAISVQVTPVEPASRLAVQDGDGVPRREKVVAEVGKDGVRPPILVQIGDAHEAVVVHPTELQRILDVEE
jgi:hypothetical protein